MITAPDVLQKRNSPKRREIPVPLCAGNASGSVIYNRGKRRVSNPSLLWLIPSPWYIPKPFDALPPCLNSFLRCTPTTLPLMARMRSEKGEWALIQESSSSATRWETEAVYPHGGGENSVCRPQSTGKWFPSSIKEGKIQGYKDDLLMLADLGVPLPTREVLPEPRDGEHVLCLGHFGWGLGFPLHTIMRGLLHFLGC